MFAAEDPESFSRRVAEAFTKRSQTEALLRYNMYIDCMPMEGVGELDQASLKRMTEWAKGAPSLSKDKTCVYVHRLGFPVFSTYQLSVLLPKFKS